MRMLNDNPVLLSKRKNLLFLPSSPEKILRLYPKLELLMCHLSGDLLKAKETQYKTYYKVGIILLSTEN